MRATWIMQWESTEEGERGAGVGLEELGSRKENTKGVISEWGCSRQGSLSGQKRSLLKYVMSRCAEPWMWYVQRELVPTTHVLPAPLYQARTRHACYFSLVLSLPLRKLNVWLVQIKVFKTLSITSVSSIYHPFCSFVVNFYRLKKLTKCMVWIQGNNNLVELLTCFVKYET